MCPVGSDKIILIAPIVVRMVIEMECPNHHVIMINILN